MAVSSLYIRDVYAGLLACGDIVAYNQCILDGLEKGAGEAIRIQAPVFIEVPKTAPQKLSRFCLTVLLDGWPEESAGRSTIDEDGDEYDGFHMKFICFIDSISGEEIDKAIERAWTYFGEHSKGWFY